MARYLIRFDDLCPAMNWDAWDRIEAVLSRAGVQPLLGVVPDNRDPRLEVGPARGDFWDRVRSWQSRGWTIGMHGYQHRYVSCCGGLVGIKPQSEFAGTPAAEQRQRLESAAALFAREGVDPVAWVAPGHSFDDSTLEALPAIGIGVVSDGLFLGPRLDRRGLLWIPQQLWRFRRLPLGVWTVCFHHNRWGARELERLEQDLARFRPRITGVAELRAEYAGARSVSTGGLAPALLRGSIRLRVRMQAGGR